MTLKRLLAVACTLVALLPVAAHASLSAGAVETTLDNGLKVIVKPDRRAPVVISQLWYRVGSIDETNGITGISHVLEHMMFKGTPSVPAGEFSRVVAAAGGKENAFTSRDHTVYHQQLAASQLPLVIRLEADRMRNLILDADEFAKEIQVVMEERRWRIEDQPGSLLYEVLLGTALQAHPYRLPVIGYMDDLRHMTIDDVRDWYRRWYAPNNATLVVVGDVEPEQVFALAREHFGPVPAAALPARKPQAEPEQNGIRRVHMSGIAEQPTVTMAWRAPTLTDPAGDWRPYAIDILAGVLNGYPGARLGTSLVREQRIAADVDAYYDGLGRGPSLFMLGGTPADGVSIVRLEQALRDQVARIQKEGVRPEELARVKSQVIAAMVYARDSISHQAKMIGNLESAGVGYRNDALMLERMRAVTAEQVQEVARELFVDERLTIAILDPLPMPANGAATGAPKGPPPGARH